jgi:hypothetical protein
MTRPCRYCAAAYGTDGLFAAEELSQMCEWEHRDDQRVYDLATAMARVFQQRNPSDEQVAWFLDDADAVVDDFDPAPEKWRVRRLPETKYDEFDARMRINDVTYVLQAGGKEKTTPVRLSTLRGWQKEANEEARARG